MSVYVTSYGIELPAIGYAEALELIHELAKDNQPEIDFPDDTLDTQIAWQQTALDTLEDFITNHEESLDDLSVMKKAGEWPRDVVNADREADPNQVFEAIRICLDLAMQNALELTDAEEDGMEDEFNRQHHALDMVEDLIGLHGDELKKIVSIDISSIVKP